MPDTESTMQTTYQDIVTMIATHQHPDRIAASIVTPKVYLDDEQKADLLHQIGRTPEQAARCYHARNLESAGRREGMIATAYADLEAALVERLGQLTYIPLEARPQVLSEVEGVVDAMLADWGAWEARPLEAWGSWRREALRRTWACSRLARAES